MGKWNRNREGYADITAGIAIGRVSREERKIAMAKKRNCRRTTDESIIHEKAVKMRKMTDEQLVHYVEDRVEKARSEGFNQGKAQAPNTDRSALRKLSMRLEMSGESGQLSWRASRQSSKSIWR